ncbi:MAG: hypothetical protein OEL84_02765 [Nitrosopumilus sp.]|nr:hypothetical protein [Nitrosopumilus sp.]
MLTIIISAIIFSPTVNAEIFQSNEYGFSIEYPENWYVDDTILSMAPVSGFDDGGASVVFLSDDSENWNHSIEVVFIKNDVLAINSEGVEYIEKVKNRLIEFCESATFQFDGFECSNHSIIDSKIIEINGREAYQIKEFWTQTYSDGSEFNNISILTNFVMNNNVWTIDSINTVELFTKDIENQINETINSFILIDNFEPDVSSKLPDNFEPDVSSKLPELFIQILTERVRYVPGQIVNINGVVADSNTRPVDTVISLTVSQKDQETHNIVYKQSVFAIQGKFRDQGLNLDEPGTYIINATAPMSSVNTFSFTTFEVVNIFATNAAFISYLGLAAFASLMILLIKVPSNPSKREILRFTCVTIIALTPIAVFVFTDVEIGQGAPIGLVVKPKVSESETSRSIELTNNIIENEWMINLGGTYAGGYKGGLQIPVFVLIFGIAGGYIRYLNTTYKLIKKDTNLVKNLEINNSEIYETRISLLRQSLKDLSLLFLAPLLAIASFFLLQQGGVQMDDLPTLAAVSFAVGLVTDNIISKLEDILGKQKPQNNQD